MLDYIYFDMSLVLSPRELVMQEFASPDFMSRVLTYQQLPFSAAVLCWVTIFDVKVSYLRLFRQIDRLKTVLTYWMVTVGTVVVSGIFLYL